MEKFANEFFKYLIEVVPAIFVGFLLSGVIYEFVPNELVQKWLGKRGIKPIILATLTGTILPICCWGSLPIALSFHKKGARLGPVIAFLVATPATSVTALVVCFRLLNLGFTIFIFLAVILMGLIIGMLGNFFYVSKDSLETESCCATCCEEDDECHKKEKSLKGRFRSILKFAFIQMPKDMGLEMLIGLALAAAIVSIVPIGNLIKDNLSGGWGYPFSVIFGLIMYICSTASVPMVHAFIKQGMNIGAGMVLLIVGPVTSFGTILVVRKHFGNKVLLFYVISICIISLLLGFIFLHVMDLGFVREIPVFQINID